MLKYYNKTDKEKVVIDRLFTRGVSNVQKCDKTEENLIPFILNSLEYFANTILDAGAWTALTFDS